MITEDGNIKYEIPEDIKKLISYGFLKEFRSQLFRIDGCSLRTTEDEGLYYNTGTSAWYASLGKACLNTNNKELFKYYHSLPWYDSDLFDSELADMMVDSKLMLRTAKEIISKNLDIKEEELYECDSCCGIFTRDMVIELDKEIFCKWCDDSKGGSRNATDYYLSSLKEIEKFISDGESDD